MPLKKQGLLLSIALLVSAFPLFAVSGDFDCSKNVRHEPDGSVVIENIPQVAQRGGYCVPSSIEMILRYYGADYTSKRLGGIFKSRRGKGTFVDKVALGFSSGVLAADFRLTPIYELWPISSGSSVAYADRCSLVRAYLKEEETSQKRGKIKKGKIRAERPDIDAFDAMDPQIARKAFSKCRRGLMKKLADAVECHVNAGLPLSWGVFMNFDPNDHSDGGHWRIICGYKKQNGEITEIIYRDSWGAVEKLKRVTLLEAGAMTKELYSIAPKTILLPKLKNIAGISSEEVFAKISEDVQVALIRVDVYALFLDKTKKNIRTLAIGKYEITQKQYSTLMGSNPSRFVGDDRPVENVSWSEAIEFCKKLTFQERATGNLPKNQAYTLPGSLGTWYCYSDSGFDLNSSEWCAENSGGETHPVGQKSPNEFGFFDCCGNVSEWAIDQTVLGGNFASLARKNGLKVSTERDATIGLRIVLVELPEK